MGSKKRKRNKNVSQNNTKKFEKSFNLRFAFIVPIVSVACYGVFLFLKSNNRMYNSAVQENLQKWTPVTCNIKRFNKSEWKNMTANYFRKHYMGKVAYALACQRMMQSIIII